MSEKQEQQPLVRDLYRHLDSVTNSRLPAARAHYEYLTERIDRSNDRIRTGLIVLNSAALLGVLTALGTDAVSQAHFGISITDLAFSACAFIFGAVLAAIAVMVDSWRLPREAALQFDRLSRQENLRAALDMTLTDENLEGCKTRMDDVHDLPPADFTYSPTALWLTNAAGGAWIAGMILPLFRVGEMIDWLAT